MAGHVGQRIETVLGAQLDLVDRLASRHGLAREGAGLVQPAVGARIEIVGVGLQRVGAVALDIDRHRLRQALRAQHVEPARLAVHIGHRRQAVLRAGLVGRHERRSVGDGRVRTGEMGDSDLGQVNLRVLRASSVDAGGRTIITHRESIQKL